MDSHTKSLELLEWNELISKKTGKVKGYVDDTAFFSSLQKWFRENYVYVHNKDMINNLSFIHWEGIREMSLVIRRGIIMAC